MNMIFTTITIVITVVTLSYVVVMVVMLIMSESVLPQKSKQDGKSTQTFQSGRKAETVQRAHVDCKSAKQEEQPAAGWIFIQREIKKKKRAYLHQAAHHDISLQSLVLIQPTGD